MPVLVPALGLAYFAVPKNACTSVKEALFALNEGRPFAPWTGPDGRRMYIHNTPGYFSAYATPETFAETAGLLRIAVIRDPIRRLVSCWKNRVLHHRELSVARAGAEVFAQHGLPPDPDFDLFIEKLDGYRALSWSIGHHTDLQVRFLGHDPAAFAEVYGMEDLPALQQFLSDLAGAPVTLGHLQRGGREFPDPEITEVTRRRMRAYATEDYDHWRFD